MKHGQEESNQPFLRDEEHGVGDVPGHGMNVHEVVELRNKIKAMRAYNLFLLFLVLMGCSALILSSYMEYQVLHPKIDPKTSKPVFPTQYEADLLISMPYMDLHESVYVHVDEEAGKQRLSYYGGLDTYFFTTGKSSAEIIPIMDKFQCYKFGPMDHLQHVFPDLTNFNLLIDHVKVINNHTCLVWEYTKKTTDNSAMDVFLGRYTMYVDMDTKEPVRYHYTGHNLMLGGSHVDEYIIDYIFVRAGPVASSFFQIPNENKCETAPSDMQHKSNPLNDLKLLFPEGTEHKKQLFQDFQVKYERQFTTEHEKQRRETNFHHSHRFVNSMNRKVRWISSK